MSVQTHYGSDGIVNCILTAISMPDPRPGSLKAEQLYPFDQLHGRELLATKDHTARLACDANDRILDIGCGIGGPARYIAATYGSSVEGIDVTPPFIDAAAELTRLCGLQGLASFQKADASRMPFADQYFDGAICFYVGMNLAQKADVIGEAFRCLRPGAKLIWTQVVTGTGEHYYPLPWSKEPSTSYLLDAGSLESLFSAAGFKLVDVVDEFSQHVELARERARSAQMPSDAQKQANEIVLGQDFVERRRNYIRCLSEGRLTSLVIEAERP